MSHQHKAGNEVFCVSMRTKPQSSLVPTYVSMCYFCVSMKTHNQLNGKLFLSRNKPTSYRQRLFWSKELRMTIKATPQIILNKYLLPVPNFFQKIYASKLVNAQSSGVLHKYYGQLEV